jgi:type II secretory pathway pseudopilin PulG
MLLSSKAFNNKKKYQMGFSLIELSVVISIAASATVAFLSWTQPDTLTDAQNAIETRDRINKIERAIEAFRVERDRLPCPADPYMRIDNSRNNSNPDSTANTHDDTDFYENDFGTEDLDETDSTVNDPIFGSVTTHGIDCPVTTGAVPVQSLGLSNIYINDAWGRRFTYVISQNLCHMDEGNESGLTDEESRSSGCTRNDYENNSGDISIVSDSAATSTFTNAAAYVLISHGSNGAGAFLPSGSKLPASANTDEAENSNDDFVFVKKSNDGDYDDITSFKTKVQIERLTSRSNAKQLTIAECEANSQAIKNIVASDANSMTEDIDDYEHVAGLYNTGEQVGLGLMMAVQDICISYYGYLPAAVRDEIWYGAQCPGNDDTPETGVNINTIRQNYISESTYSSQNNVCTCASGLWDGNCEMDWFMASGLTVSTSNVVFWLDASNPETVFSDDSCQTPAVIDSDTVECWADKSGNNIHAKQTSANQEPSYISNGINSLDSIDFVVEANLTSDFMILDDNSSPLASETAGEIFGVSKKYKNVSTANVNQGPLWSFGTSSNAGMFPRNNGLIYDDFGTNTRKDNISYNQDLRGNVLYNVSSIDSEWQARMNGIEIDSDSSNTVAFRADPHIGKRHDISNYFDGMIGEIIMYDDKLEAGNRKLVESYLGDKWGVSIIPISSSASTPPLLWLDADDSATLFEESGCTTLISNSTIGCWTNKGTGSGNATQTDSTNFEPSLIKESNMNYRNVVMFDGNDYLNVDAYASTFASQFTLLIVGDYTDDRDNTSIFSVTDSAAAGGADVFRYRYRTTGEIFELQSKNVGASDPSYTDVTNVFSFNDPPFILGTTSTGVGVESVNLYFNGVNETTSTALEYTARINPDQVTIGADYNGGSLDRELIGYVGEILLYDSVLSEANRAEVETYLADKWGIEINN